MSRSRTDRLLLWTLRGLALLAASVVLCIAGFVLLESLPALRHIGPLRFARDASWHPIEGLYNILPLFVGTLLVAGGALLLAVPLGVLAAVFGRHYAPPLVGGLFRRLVQLLAGIPSVVFGFWGLVVLVPLIASIEPPGASLLGGILVLALMILPTVALLSEASLAAVPREYLLGAAALGLTHSASLWRVLLPAARKGIYTGIFLGAARALGETMAVLMVCGNVVQVPGSLFDPVRALTANIALEMAYAMGDHRSALFVSGLALILLVVLLVLAAEALGGGRIRAEA